MTTTLEAPEKTARQRFDATDYSGYNNVVHEHVLEQKRKAREAARTQTPFEIVMANIGQLTASERQLVISELHALATPPAPESPIYRPFVPTATRALVAQMRQSKFKYGTPGAAVDEDDYELDEDELGEDEIADWEGDDQTYFERHGEEPVDDAHTVPVTAQLADTQEVDMGPYLEDEYEGPGITAITDDELGDMANWNRYAGNIEREPNWFDSLRDWWDRLMQKRRHYQDYVSGSSGNQYESTRNHYVQSWDAQSGEWAWRNTGPYPVPFGRHTAKSGRSTAYSCWWRRLAWYLKLLAMFIAGVMLTKMFFFNAGLQETLELFAAFAMVLATSVMCEVWSIYKFLLRMAQQ